MELKLTPAERSALRAQAHALDPVVMIGADGLTPAVIREIDANLKAHQLIKIRVLGDDRELRTAFWERICGALDAAPVQHIGKLLIVWRPAPEQAPRSRTQRIQRAESTTPRAATTAARKRGAAPKEVVIVKPSRTGKRPATRRLETVLGNQRVTQGGLVKRAKPRQSSAKKKSSG